MNFSLFQNSHVINTVGYEEYLSENSNYSKVSEHQPHVVLLVGDVNSTIACALVASKIQYNSQQGDSGTQRQHRKGLRPLIVHVDAGLRSFDRTMPEEVNRFLRDAFSDLLFIREEDAMVNLEREGIPREKILFVGNVMIDTLLVNLEKTQDSETSQIQKDFHDSIRNGYGLVTLHRPSNVDQHETLNGLMDCLKAISCRLPIILSLHPRTRFNLERFGIYQTLVGSKGIVLTEPLGYLEFLRLLRSARLVLTDSGGIQEETTFLRIPCITLRENTEPPVTINLGTNYLIGTRPEEILETAFAILDGRGKKGQIPALWDGKAGHRIVDILIKKTVTSYR